MAETVRGIVEAELRADRFLQPAKQITDSLKSIETASRSSLGQVKSSVQEAETRLTRFGNEGKKALKGVGNAATIMQAQLRVSTQQAAQDVSAVTDATRQVGHEATTAGDTSRASFESIGIAAKGASAQVSSSSNVSRTSVSAVGTAAKGTGDQFVAMGAMGRSAFVSVGQSAQATSVQMRALSAEAMAGRTAMYGMMGSVAGLGASFVGLEMSMSNIPKRLNAIAKTESLVETQQVALARQTTALEKQIMSLNKGRESGKKTAQELALMEQTIADTRANITLYTGKLADAQEDLRIKHMEYDDTLKQMATSMATTFLTAGTTTLLLLSQLSVNAGTTITGYLGMQKAALLNSRVLNSDLGPSIKRASLALRGYAVSQTSIGTTSYVAVAGLHRVSVGLKGVYAALGPVGWGIIGVTSAWMAWESNLFGFQDAARETVKWLREMWDILKWVVPVIGAVDEAWKAWDPEGHSRAAESLSAGIDAIGKSSETLADATGELAAAQALLGDEFGATGSAAGEFALSADAAQGSMAGLTQTTQAASRALGSFKQQIRSADKAYLDSFLSGDQADSAWWGRGQLKKNETDALGALKPEPYKDARRESALHNLGLYRNAQGGGASEAIRWAEAAGFGQRKIAVPPWIAQEAAAKTAYLKSADFAFSLAMGGVLKRGQPRPFSIFNRAPGYNALGRTAAGRWRAAKGMQSIVADAGRLIDDGIATPQQLRAALPDLRPQTVARTVRRLRREHEARVEAERVETARQAEFHRSNVRAYAAAVPAHLQAVRLEAGVS